MDHIYIYIYILIRKTKRKSNQISNWNSIGVCLFESETGWMKNFEEKIRNKIFLECVWLDREKEK